MTSCGNEFCSEAAGGGAGGAREQRCKRKEHDESPKNCCKFTKSTGSKEAMTGPFWMKWMAPGTQEQEEAALEEEKERLQKYYITAEKYSVQAQAQERLERPEPKSRKAKDPASKMKQISKKIGKLQEEIKAVEEELEEKAGHPLSKADKVKDETLGNLMGKVKKLKKQKQELKEKEKDSPKPVEGIKDRIEENMENMRALADRPYALEEMTLEELEAEKEELQEQLEEVSEELGGLARKEERKACADLFLRLRQLKRMTRRPSYSSSGAFLDEIPEHSSVEHSWSRRGSIESVSLSEEFEEELDESDEKGEEVEEEDEEGDWHIMTKEELHNAVIEMKGQKGRLKQLIKEFDQGVQAKTGRKVTKEERAPIENIYHSYKKTKARIKLIEALLTNKTSE